MGTYRKTYGNKRRAYTSSRQSVAKAAQLIRARMVGAPRAPLSTRGFSGAYAGNRRGIPELKYTDNSVVISPILGSGTIQLVNGIAQGTDFNQRIGRQATMKSVLFNGNWYQSTTSSPLGCLGRAVVVYDAQPNSGSTPVWTDIFAQADVNSPMNLNNRDRFKVLMDIRKSIGPTAYTSGNITAGGWGSPWHSKYRKCNLETIFSGTGITLGSISTGAIYVCVICDTTSAMSLNFYFRVRFTDS